MRQILLNALIVFFFVAFITFDGLRPANAEHVGEEEEGVVVLLTNDLLRHINQLLRAQADQKPKVVERIKSIIEKRKARLEEMLEKNPKVVLQQLLPDQLINGFPDEIKELLEARVEMEGELAVIVSSDFELGITKTAYTLTNTSTKKVYRLHFVEHSPNLLTGSIIKIRGIKLDSNLILENGDFAVTPAGGGSGEVISAATSMPSGDQKTIVMMVNFSDATVPCQTETTRAAVFATAGTSNNTYFKETSFNKLSFSGDVVGPLTIPYSQSTSTICNDYYTIANLADTAATNSGIVLSNYTRKLYAIPSISCGWAGLSNVGGNPSRSWVQGSYCSSVRVIAHELGHAIGMHHASSVSSTGAISEYGDASDVMGNSLRQVNAPHKYQMGWILPERVMTISSSGVYTLDSVENSSPIHPQALKFSKPDTGDDYYFSFRQPIGYDASLSTVYSKKLNIHRYKQGGKTFHLNSLDDGYSFVDTINGISIQQLSHTDTQSTVSVTLSAPTCARSNPQLYVSPASKTGPSGGSLFYSVTIVNKNSPACAAATYQLGQVLPTGWSGSFSPTALVLSSGASGSVGWTVASAPSLPDGINTISVRATDMENATFYTIANASYVIYTDVIAPTVNITSPIDGATVSGKVSISANATDNIAVKSVEFYIDGVLKSTDTTAPYVYTWNTVNVAGGMHALYAKAYDTSNNSKSSSVQGIFLKTPTKGGGKN